MFLLFLVLPSTIFAVINDAILHDFCLSPYIEFNGGLPANQRIGNQVCTQNIPQYSDDPDTRKKLCKHYGPFNVYAAEPVTTPFKMTKCVWGVNQKCRRSNEKLIDTICVASVPPDIYAEQVKVCNGSMLTVHSWVQGTWIVKFMSKMGPNIYVSNTVTGSQSLQPKDRTIGFSRSNYDYGVNYTQMSLVASHDWEIGVSMGMLVPTNGQERLPTICTSTPIKIHHPPGLGNATEPPLVSNGTCSTPFVTISPDLSVYMSEMFTFDKVNTKVTLLNVDKMDMVCQKFSTDSFPLFPTKVIVDKILPVLVGPVYVIGFMSPPANVISHCGSNYTSNADNLKTMFKTFDHNRKEVAIDPTLWETGYPKPICSKHAAVAVVINRRGRLQNFPSSARLPMLCGMGARPQLPDVDKCSTAFSEVGPDGNCRCQVNTTDIVNSNSSARRDYPPGVLCLHDRPCENRKEPLYFYMVVDSSNSIGWQRWDDDIAPFLYSIIDIVPEHAIGGITKFDLEFFESFCNPWNKTQLREHASKFVGMVSTDLVGPFESLHAHLVKELANVKGKYRLIMMLITDGQYSGDWQVPLEKIKALGSRVLCFSIGSNDAFNCNEVATSPSEVLIEPDMKILKNHLSYIMNRVCPEHSDGDWTNILG